MSSSSSSSPSTITVSTTSSSSLASAPHITPEIIGPITIKPLDPLNIDQRRVCIINTGT